MENTQYRSRSSFTNLPDEFYVRQNTSIALQCNRPTSNNDERKLCCRVACGDYFKAYLMSIVITVTM